MKKTNKKGFTIVELVIVIAVIAILAGVLIPTFAGVVSRAKESAALQKARNAYTECLAATDADLTKLSSLAAADTSKITTDTGVTSVSYSGSTFTVVVDTEYTFTYTTTAGWVKSN